MSCEDEINRNVEYEMWSELKECFVMFDKSGKGKIPACLVGRALRALGQNPSNRSITSLLQSCGKRGNDEIDCQEFVCIVSNYEFKTDNEMLDDLTNAFKVFDRQEVGSINVCELKCWLEKSEEPLTRFQISDLIKMSGGKATDESFDYNEFLKRIVYMQS